VRPVFFIGIERRIRRHFGISVAETKQFMWLILVLVFWFGISVVFHSFQATSESVTSFDSEVQDILHAYRFEQRREADWEAKNNVNIQPKIFNPNECTGGYFIAMGLPKWLADNVLKYRDKGGQFRIKADFKKIYGLKAEWYAILEPYLALPDSLARNEYLRAGVDFPKYVPKAKRQHQIFDINTADSSVWQDFPGIGVGMSHRIIEYRAKLGGFTSVQQVKEVYGMDTLVLCELKPFMQVYSLPFHRLNINKLSVDDLAKHPYIKYKEAKAIVQYRLQHGDYDQVASLRFIKSLDWEWIERVSPYLCVCDGD